MHPEKWPQKLIDDGKNVHKNIVIPYGVKHGGRFYKKEGIPLEYINPKGFSGCGIWYYPHKDEYLDKPIYALLGIQTSYYPRNQLLIGTLLEPLINEICKRHNIVI